ISLRTDIAKLPKVTIISCMARFAQRFVLEREIGAGGIARVFLGKDEVLGRLVAVKILRGGFEDSEVSARFRREGRTAARLSHPNIVPVYDAGEDELEGREVSYIVMEYISGGDLKALIDAKGTLSNEELVQLGAEASSGLAHAHEKGIVHRDIKPHNILIDSYGRPKLTDFGIARALDATQATRTGSYLGTALYSSPEQLRGERVTPKSDVYSLGITLYQAAVGELPFTGTPIEVASQHVSRVPTAPRTLDARLSSEVEALILDCLQKNPNLRPSAEDVQERLQEAAQRPHRSIHTNAASLVSKPAPPERTRTTPTEDSPAPPPLADRPPTTGRTRATTPEVSSVEPTSGLQREGEQGRRRRGPAILASAALLMVVLGVAAAFAALGGGEDPDLTQASQEESVKQVTPSAEGEEPISTQKQGTQGNATGDQGGSGAEAAVVQAVKDFYTYAADLNYDASSALLTKGQLASTFPTRDRFAGTFNTLRSVSFADEPQVEVSGNTATVTGTTVARHTDRTERNSGTWTLVNEDGGWRISGWTVSPISTEPPV
ncbi:MAG TPA: protein kinase, partial [Rubrobacteraceae bacterium]|nr:protein kinase [Rubrobacteraceae bacterium]